MWQGVRPSLSGQQPLEQTTQVTSSEEAEAYPLAIGSRWGTEPPTCLPLSK